MAERYPSQDLTDSLEGYQWDFERLALRYSLDEVQEALAEWRVTPGARFFPRPDEIAEQIERERNKRNRLAEEEAREGRRRAEDAYFRRLMSAEEVAWRIARFGYDPYKGKQEMTA